MSESSNIAAKEVPAVKNKTMKTMTMCARAHKMFPDLHALALSPDPVSILVLGSNPF